MVTSQFAETYPAVFIAAWSFNSDVCAASKVESMRAYFFTASG